MLSFFINLFAPQHIRFLWGYGYAALSLCDVAKSLNNKDKYNNE